MTSLAAEPRLIMGDRKSLAAIAYVGVTLLAAPFVFNGTSAWLSDRAQRALTAPMENMAHAIEGSMTADERSKITTRTDQLDLIQQSADARGCVVNDVSDDPKEPSGILVSAAGTYRGLTLFLADLETAGFEVGELSFTQGKAASLDLDVRLLASASSKEAGRARMAALRENWFADPFSAERAQMQAGPGKPVWDLSAEHRLSGIGTVGSRSIATIDGRDYQAGDALGDWQVRSVESARVQLDNREVAGTQGFISFRAGAAALPKP